MQREVAVRAHVSSERPRRSGSYWLIVGQDGTRKVLTLHSRLRGEILPVFGSDEDAGMFLTPLGAFGGGFTPQAIAAEDLASLLWGPLSSVGTVALDPTTGVDPAAALDLISTDRESFVEHLTKERATAGAWPGEAARVRRERRLGREVQRAARGPCLEGYLPAQTAEPTEPGPRHRRLTPRPVLRADGHPDK
jgi:hypothetical protein